MKYFWFTFSNGGENAGVVIITAINSTEAIKKGLLLDVFPIFDSLEAYQIEGLESGMQAHILYSTEDMINFGYVVQQQ